MLFYGHFFAWIDLFRILNICRCPEPELLDVRSTNSYPYAEQVLHYSEMTFFVNSFTSQPQHGTAQNLCFHFADSEFSEYVFI